MFASTGHSPHYGTFPAKVHCTAATIMVDAALKRNTVPGSTILNDQGWINGMPGTLQGTYPYPTQTGKGKSASSKVCWEGICQFQGRYAAFQHLEFWWDIVSNFDAEGTFQSESRCQIKHEKMSPPKMSDSNVEAIILLKPIYKSHGFSAPTSPNNKWNGFSQISESPLLVTTHDSIQACKILPSCKVFPCMNRSSPETHIILLDHRKITEICTWTIEICPLWPNKTLKGFACVCVYDQNPYTVYKRLFLIIHINMYIHRYAYLRYVIIYVHIFAVCIYLYIYTRLCSRFQNPYTRKNPEIPKFHHPNSRPKVV